MLATVAMHVARAKQAATAKTAAVATAAIASAWGLSSYFNLMSGAMPVAHASGDDLHAAAYPWNHRLPWQSFDYRAIRRGFKVYQQVCSTCHSLEYIAYRNLVNVAFTEDEVKAIAADVEIQDGPDDKGEMFERPGKLADYLPSPYPNEQAARAANAGAYPVDLSLVVKARHGGEDYIYSLLTGYKEPPAGVAPKPGLYYNPYFPGGWIAMPQQLLNDMVEFDDKTPSNISQMAKDVSTFLTWAAEPKQDEHKLMGIKGMLLASLLSVQFWWWKRMKWSVYKHRQISFILPKKDSH